MLIDTRNLPDDPHELKEIIFSLTTRSAEETNHYRETISTQEKRIEDLTKKNSYLDSEMKYLSERLKIALKDFYGRKSEKLAPQDIHQGLLFDEIECYAPEEKRERIPIPAHMRAKPGRSPIPKHFPRTDIVIDIPEAEKTCACGARRVKIGEETSEKLDLIPAKIDVKKYIRYKYACPCCEGVETEDEGGAVRIAPVLPHIIPKGMASEGLLAHVIVSKFADHLPFYRQEKMFMRIGVDIGRATMCNWAMACHEGSRRLLELMLDDMKAKPLVGIDETTLQVMQEPGRKDTTKSHMWLMRGGGEGNPIMLYQYRTTRSGEWLENFFKGYRGTIQSDGFSGYERLEKMEGIIHAGCWAHARRKFIEASEVMKGNDHIQAAGSFITRLYSVETTCREKELAPDEIREQRQTISKPLLVSFHEFLMQIRHNVPPKCAFGKAIAYALNGWPRLLVYLDDGRIPIDNNFVENGIRPFVVGRKNWLFSGSPAGADASAGLYSLIETAKANGLEPYWYLRYIFERLPYAENDEDFRKLLPYVLDGQFLSEYAGGVVS